MSKIWSIMIIFSVLFAIAAGNSESIINNITTGAVNAVENVFTFMGMLCFWNGIFNILKSTSLINKLSKVITPVTSKLFRRDEVDEEILESIALNVTADALGAGNAATIYSVDAIKKMQNKNNNKEKLNDSMGMFILLNTASIQIIPTTMISLRVVYGSENPLAIVLPVWIVTSIALAVGLFAMKILNKVVKWVKL